MVLVCEQAPVKGMYFPEQELKLTSGDSKKIFCRVMVMYVTEKEVDLSFITETKYRMRGYASRAAKMMVPWALHNGIKKLTITNLANSIAVDKIAAGAGFQRSGNNKWVKNLTGPVNICTESGDDSSN